MLVGYVKRIRLCRTGAFGERLKQGVEDERAILTLSVFEFQHAPI